MHAEASHLEDIWPFGGGMMGALIRARDWTRTPVGPMEAWPQSLKTAVGIMLTTRHPVFIFWGPQQVSFYNDAFAASLGPEKHPSILGTRGSEAWPEIWHIIEPQIEQVMTGGEATWHENHLVPIIRHGRREEVYWTYSYGPIHDADAPNGVGGVLVLITETTQAVVSRRESEDRYRKLFDSIDEGFCILQLDFDEDQNPIDYRFIETNPAFEQQSGLRNVLGRTVRELVPALEPSWIDVYGAVARTGKPMRFVDCAQSLDRWFDVYAFRIGEPHKRHVAVLFTDISDRKRDEDALRESEERFRLMADAVPAIAWITDVEGRVKFFNRKWSDYTGASYEPTMVAEVITSFIHPDDAALTAERFEEAQRTGGTFLVEHRLRAKDGSYRWFLVRGEPYRDPRNGAIISWFGASTDIHDRKVAEAALRISEEQYRGLVESQADLIVRIGADGLFTFVNDTTCRTFGRSRDELLNSHWSQFVHPDDAGAIRAAIQETMTSTDHRTTVEARILTVNGVRWYGWEGFAILDVTGRFVEKQSVGRDITERKAMEDALRQAKDEAERAQAEAEQATFAKSRFLAAASHDLRQPMQSLLLFLDVLKPQVAPKGQEALKHLGRGLDALRDLLDSLLDVSRLDAGIVEPAIENFAIGQVVDQIGSAYAPIAAAKGLDFHVASCKAVVRSDRTLLGRMVRNLVENALRYTEQGRITIECHETRDTLRIDVADTGIGIPPDQLERIWEEFHQVGNPERDRNRGLGLGLAIVQRLSSLLKHPVEVRSTPDKGSVFTIEVPLGHGEPRRISAPTIEVAGNGRLALLVDDDAIVLLALKVTFEAWGYAVLAVGSADQALAKLEEGGRRPDIVVADYRLREGRNGIEAILRVREAYGTDIAGIILTGETGTEVQRDAVEHRLGIIHKPVTPRQLSIVLENQMKGADALR